MPWVRRPWKSKSSPPALFASATSAVTLRSAPSLRSRALATGRADGAAAAEGSDIKIPRSEQSVATTRDASFFNRSVSSSMPAPVRLTTKLSLPGRTQTSNRSSATSTPQRWRPSDPFLAQAGSLCGPSDCSGSMERQAKLTHGLGVPQGFRSISRHRSRSINRQRLN